MNKVEKQDREGITPVVNESEVKRLAIARVNAEIGRRKAQAYADRMFRQANHWPATMPIPHGNTEPQPDGTLWNVHRVQFGNDPIQPLSAADVAIWTADRQAHGLSTVIPDDPWDADVANPKDPNSPLYG